MVLASKMMSVEFVAVMALRTAHAIATETYWMPWANAEGRAHLMPTITAFAMIKNRLDARMIQPAITIQALRRTMVLALKMTSAVFAAVTALRTAHAIVTETYWMPWANVEVRAHQMRIRMAFAMISSNQVARILLRAITRKVQQKMMEVAITAHAAKQLVCHRATQ
tara:strand:+ start:137 stop:637 length:501 start_codon:yes stop_codon:yes gene_type:complete